MENKYEFFEHLSTCCGVGVSIVNLAGECQYATAALSDMSAVTRELFRVLDCEAVEQMALLYSVLQSRRYGGRNVFIAPSGFSYCSSPILGENGAMTTGAIAGPFLMVDHSEYFEIDFAPSCRQNGHSEKLYESSVSQIPYFDPSKVRALNELLFTVSTRSKKAVEINGIHIRIDALAFPLEKEGELLEAVSMGKSEVAARLLNDILGQVLFNSAGDIEVLRSRVFELIILLSNAAHKSGANANAIFGLKHEALRKIDAFSHVEGIIEWLCGITKRFGQHVFDLQGIGQTNVTRKAIDFMNVNYMNKITLQDIADSVFLSPTYFSKLFRDDTGLTPISFLTQVRINMAKKLLSKPHVNVSKVHEMVGFENQSYFSRVFKKIENQTPNDYRKKNHTVI